VPLAFRARKAPCKRKKIVEQAEKRRTLSRILWSHGRISEKDMAMRILKPSEYEQFRGARVMTPEEEAEALALARAAFTAVDLQRYAELDEGISAEELMAQLEEAQREYDAASKP